MARSAWYAEDGSVTIGGTDFTQEVKDMTVRGGERDLDIVRTFGNGSFPNPKPMTGAIEASFTMKKLDIDLDIMVMGGSGIGATSGGSAFYDGVAPAVQRTVLFNTYDLNNVSGEQIQVKFASAYFTGIEDSLNSTDSWEQTVNIKCDPKLVIKKYTNNRVVSPITA